MKEVPCIKCILLALCVTKKYSTVCLRGEECKILADYLYSVDDPRSFQSRVLEARKVFKLEALLVENIMLESWEREQRAKEYAKKKKKGSV